MQKRLIVHALARTGSVGTSDHEALAVINRRRNFRPEAARRRRQQIHAVEDDRPAEHTKRPFLSAFRMYVPSLSW